MAYYPKSQITTNLYTNGGEFTRIDNNEIYRGYYWKNSSNKYYSGKTPNDTPSIELIESPKPKQLKPTDVTYTEGPAELNPSPEWLVNYRGLTKSSPGKLPQKSQTIPTKNGVKANVTIVHYFHSNDSYIFGSKRFVWNSQSCCVIANER